MVAIPYSGSVGIEKQIPVIIRNACRACIGAGRKICLSIKKHCRWTACIKVNAGMYPEIPYIGFFALREGKKGIKS
jgi:hypothetical protein